MIDSSMSAVILPARCDRATAEALLPELAAAAASASGPVEIDGRNVEQIGQAMLQLLLSARRTGRGATLVPSPRFAEAARLAGLSDDLFADARP